jgi:hypothetical protein
VSDSNFLQSANIYSEIARGYSEIYFDKTFYYIKHLTFSEQFLLSSKYQLHEEEARTLGLETEKEKINFAIKEKWWSVENEERVDFLKKAISNLEKTKSKLMYKSQREVADVQIKQFRAVLTSYIHQRNEFIGYTIENYVDKKSNEEILKAQVFKDKDLTKNYFCSENFDEESPFFKKVIEELGRIHLLFGANNIKRVAASGFFQNLIFLTDDPYHFWGKPLIKCTKYQNDLLLYGKSYRNFVKSQAENGKPINENILNDPEKLISMIENYQPSNGKKSKYNFKSKEDNAVSSYVGATSEDLGEMGVKVEKLQGQSLLQLAEKSGGVLEKEDYLKARS